MTFITKNGAKTWMAHAKQTGFGKAKVYKCDDCGLFHLTSATASKKAFFRRQKRGNLTDD